MPLEVTPIQCSEPLVPTTLLSPSLWWSYIQYLLRIQEVFTGFHCIHILLCHTHNSPKCQCFSEITIFKKQKSDRSIDSFCPEAQNSAQVHQVSAENPGDVSAAECRNTKQAWRQRNCLWRSETRWSPGTNVGKGRGNVLLLWRSQWAQWPPPSPRRWKKFRSTKTRPEAGQTASCCEDVLQQQQEVTDWLAQRQRGDILDENQSALHLRSSSSSRTLTLTQHTAKISKQWLQDNSVNVLDWTSLEHGWKHPRQLCTACGLIFKETEFATHWKMSQ